MVKLPERVIFDFESKEEIRRNLEQCAIPSVGRSEFYDHLKPLRELAVLLDSSDNAVWNALYLGKGYGDLVVVLQEPSDIEERELYENMDLGATTGIPLAIAALDKSLRFAFNDKRNVNNTIILDSRPLRFRGPRRQETWEIRKARDTDAYAALEEMLHIIRPKVILVCQCDARGVEFGLPKYLCSSIEMSGDVKAVEMRNGHRCLAVYSYHPSFITYEEVSRKVVARQDLFDTSLVVTANTLVGCEVYGRGKDRLRNIVLRQAGLVVPSPPGPNNYAPPELIQKLKSMGL